MTTFTRRNFLSSSILAGAGLAARGNSRATNAAARTAPRKLPGNERDWSELHGFNYQPSYGTTGLELWRQFDAKTIETELARGKEYFPRMNVLRWWQSWDAYLRDPRRYAVNFALTLDLAQKVDCGVIPVLFNRWHSSFDYGGVYIDHFLPGSLVTLAAEIDPFLHALVGVYRGDPRIVAWDLCNEPYFYTSALDQSLKEIPAHVEAAETAWLDRLYEKCKALGARAPLTIAAHGALPLERMNRFSDVLSIHPYWWMQEGIEPFSDEASYAKKLDGYVEYAREVGKPLIATECCVGHLDDQIRVAAIRHELAEFKKRDIGWTAYLLHHSMIADAHRPQLGPGAPFGSFAFIEADGSLRPGHEVFNEF